MPTQTKLVERKRRKRGFFHRLIIGFSLFVVAAVVIGTAAFVVLTRNLPSIDQLDTHRISQSTKIFDRSGSVLLYEISAGQRRTVVPLADIPQFLRDATIAVEDERFYDEPAFDWRGVVRAILVNINSGWATQGASTITQQLARNAFLTPEKTITRKLRELALAIQLDRHYSKDQILELYLNEIPYGPTAYGVEAASELYFGVPVKELNLSQSAVLAALPRAPSYYSPWGSHAQELIGRQQFILKKLLASDKIDEEQYQSALAFKLVFQPQGTNIKAPHFVMAVQDYLIKKYGEDLVRSGGLTVTTTLDWKFQELAERVVADGAAQNEKLYHGTNAALVAQDTRTGQVLALVGSRDYFDTIHEGNFNVATQGLRQPGSALKPFAYLTAFEKGYTPDTVLFDVPTEFVPNNPLCPPVPDFNKDSVVCFHPQDFEEKFQGPVSLRTALAQSINIPAVKVLYLAGLNDTLATLKNFGITTLADPSRYGLSLVLGGGEVKLVELVGAYAALAQEGIFHDQALVLEVKDATGQVLESYTDHAKRVIDADHVELVNNILSDSDARSGLFGQSLNLTVFPDHDVALKTGTSNDYRDAWALGYTPSLVVGVWAGNNNNAPMQRHGSSILAAVPIWHAFMDKILKDAPTETFTRPDVPPTTNPFLAGSYAMNGDVHSVLYYIDRENPLGPPPTNPADEPQFVDWELGVRAWVEQHGGIVGLVALTPSMIGAGLAKIPPEVAVVAPAAGAFLYGNRIITVEARVVSASPIVGAAIYFNGVLAREIGGGTANPYVISESIKVPALALQNRIEVRATNQDGLVGQGMVVVYE